MGTRGNIWFSSAVFRGRKNPFKYGELKIMHISTQKILAVFAVLSMFVFCDGCSRTNHRQNADREVYSLVKTAANDPRWELNKFTVQPDRDSRMYDPYNPDCEPMPPDDEAAQRLMRIVDGKKGSKAWKKYGNTQYVDNPYWKQNLSVDDEGTIHLDKETAVRLALKHSPSYQTALENLYLSALSVSSQRFVFDTQFFGGKSLFYDVNGAANTTKLTDSSWVGFKRNLAAGGQLAADLANSLTWNFSGPDTFEAKSALNFSFIQPLLRGAGRAVVLEALTQAERDFLADVRQMVYYQQGFYVSTVAGSSGVAAPSAAGGSGGGGGSGYYALLSAQVRINNRLQNIASLEDAVNRNIELFLAQQVKKIDIDNSRIRLLDSQSALLKQKGTYESSVEGYLRSIGLPPETKVKVHDPLLEQFVLMSPTLRNLQSEVNKMLTFTRDRTQTIPDNIREQIPLFTDRLRKEVEILEKDLSVLEKAVPDRVANLKFLSTRPSLRDGEVSPSACSITDFEDRVVSARIAVPKIKQRIETVCALNEHYAGFTQEEMYKNIDAESFDEKTLWGLYELGLLSLQPILNREIQLNYVQPFETQNATLIKARRELQSEVDRLDSTLQSLGQPKAGQQILDRTIQETRLKRDTAQSELNKAVAQIEKLENERDRLVRERIRKWVAGNKTTQILRATETSPGETLAFDKAKEAERKQKLTDPNATSDSDVYRNWLNRIASRLAMEMTDLLIVQSRIRLDTTTVTKIDIASDEAFDTASRNRLDWMNRRAQLVDSWRKIEIAANALRGVLDVKVDGSIETTGNNPVNFDGKTGRLSVGVQWDSPLTRLEEQNAYRTALIRYQQARRSYYEYVDRINAELRDSIRNIQISQLDFEIRRASIFTTINAVEQAQLNLEKPAQGGKVDTNAVTQLLDSLQSLLDAQNEFMEIWVNYLTQRMRLELDMGIMKLDAEGMWVESGPLVGSESENNNTLDQDMMPNLDNELAPPQLAPPLSQRLEQPEVSTMR